MAPSAVPFEPSHTAIKNLHQKVHKHTATSVKLTLPIRPQDLSTDLNPYLDNAIGILGDSTAFLYDDNAPWAVRVTEVKKGVDKVDMKVDEVKAEVAEVKAEVAEVKAEVAEVKAEVAEVKAEMKSLEKRLESQIDNIKTGVNNSIAI